MRTALWEASPGALAALLNSGQPLNKADLYDLTLPGLSVIRWTGADTALNVAGQTYFLGPGIERSKCRWSVGVNVDTLNLTLMVDATRPVAINGVPLLSYVCNGGLNGASLQLSRAFWGLSDSGPVGTLLWFRGRVSEVPELDRDMARLTVKSELERLDVKVPRQVYQAQCLATVYDAECGVSRLSFTSSGAATSTATNGRTVFGTNLGQAAGFFELGTLTFTSGANNGTSRTVKAHAAGGGITLLSPLPAQVGVGDTFTVVPGCDNRQSTCSGKFNNLSRFKGQPFIPQPETVL